MSIKIGKAEIRFVRHGDVWMHGDVWAEKTNGGWRAGAWEGDCYWEAESRTLQAAYRAVVGSLRVA